MNNKDRNILKDLNIADFKIPSSSFLQKMRILRTGHMVRSPSLRLLIIEPSDLRKTTF